MFMGWIFAMAEFPHPWQSLLIATPFVFLVVDVISGGSPNLSISLPG
jgi:hypothetical protein